VRNSNGVDLSNNQFNYFSLEPSLSSLLKKTGSPLLKDAGNQFRKGWSVWDTDGDGLADVLEPAGDADGDQLSNVMDTDSNNNGMDDFEEFKLGRNPFANVTDK